MDHDWTWEGMLAHVSTAWQKILFHAVKLQLSTVIVKWLIQLLIYMRDEYLTVFYNYCKIQ